jgi:repressor LexA
LELNRKEIATERSLDKYLAIEYLLDYNPLVKNRDAEYLEKLQDYYARHGVLPSYAGIAALIGLRTTSAVTTMVRRLKAAGFLEATPDRRLAPGRKFGGTRLVDSVRAGSPAAANDIRDDVISIDKHLISDPSRTIFLTVKGDSMIDAGLLSGDTVIVAKGAPAKPGDVVVALIDNEMTVKTFTQDKRGFYLEPANKAYLPIRAKDHLEIFGLVVGMFRRYK